MTAGEIKGRATRPWREGVTVTITNLDIEEIKLLLYARRPSYEATIICP